MKIGPVNPKIIVLRVITENKETRNAWQSLAYSPLFSVAPSEYL